MAMDDFGGRCGGLCKRKRSNRLGLFDEDMAEDMAARDVLVNHGVDKLPSLLKIILLLEEEGGDARRRLLNVSLIRCFLLCPGSVGHWLIGMLSKPGIPSMRALAYIEVVSQATVSDYILGLSNCFKRRHKSLARTATQCFRRF